MSEDFNLTPPPQEPGEDAMSYIDRLEWERLRIPKELLHAPIRGAIGSPQGPRNWRTAPYLGKAGTGKEDEGGQQALNPRYAPQRIEIANYRVLPPIRRRQDSERLHQLSGMIVDMARASYETLGYIELPISVMNKMRDIYRSWGIHMTEDDVRRQTVDGLKAGIEALAAHHLNARAPARLTPVIGGRAAPAAKGRKSRRAS